MVSVLLVAGSLVAVGVYFFAPPPRPGTAELAEKIDRRADSTSVMLDSLARILEDTAAPGTYQVTAATRRLSLVEEEHAQLIRILLEMDKWQQAMEDRQEVTDERILRALCWASRNLDRDCR